MVSSGLLSVTGQAIGQRQWGAQTQRLLEIFDIEQPWRTSATALRSCSTVESDRAALQLHRNQHRYLELQNLGLLELILASVEPTQIVEWQTQVSA